MNKNRNPLFNPKLLYEYLKKVDIAEAKIKILNEKVFNLPEEVITMGKKSGNEENVKNKIILQFLKFLDYEK